MTFIDLLKVSLSVVSVFFLVFAAAESLVLQAQIVQELVGSRMNDEDDAPNSFRWLPLVAEEARRSFQLCACVLGRLFACTQSERRGPLFWLALPCDVGAQSL